MSEVIQEVCPVCLKLVTYRSGEPAQARCRVTGGQGCCGSPCELCQHWNKRKPFSKTRLTGAELIADYVKEVTK